MFIYVSYSANIVVLLQSTTKINDVQELLDSRIEVGGCQIHYMKNYFEVFLCYECRNEARLRFVGSEKRTFEEVVREKDISGSIFPFGSWDEKSAGWKLRFSCCDAVGV
jgi:hypothetical protein